MTASPVVTCQWLSNQLSSRELEAKIRIIDVTITTPNKNGYQDYKDCHIPSAHYFNFRECENKNGNPFSFPDSDTFVQYVGPNLGIEKETHVIIYDSSKQGFNNSCKVWLLFHLMGHEKVSILDGGLNKWIQSGNATTQVEPQNICKVYNGAKRHNSMVKRLPDLVQGLESGEIILVDGRNTDNGEPKEKVIDSLSISCGDMIDKDKKQFKTVQQLRTYFASVPNLNLHKEIVVFCELGFQSAIVALGFKLIGKYDVKMYDAGLPELRKKAKERILVEE